jgi:hypothetical protein
LSQRHVGAYVEIAVQSKSAMKTNWLQALRQRYCVLTDWNIGVVDVSPADIANLVSHGRLGAVLWSPRLSRWRSRADPFIWPVAGEDGEDRVIYEEIDHWAQRGHIRSLSLARFSRLQSSRLEIARPFHMSYPFIVQCDGNWYCMPESARSNGVDLYGWDAGSGSWKLERRLIDNVGILDATFFRHDGIWYLFGTMRGDGSYDKLRIWWSESLAGDWRLHGMNPAKTDLRSARPAGPFFKSGGHWYRPAQDCSIQYGGALTINRIDVLTPTRFAETTTSRIAPDPAGPYPDGLHTLALLGDKLLIDGKRTAFCAWLPLMKAVRRIVGWVIRRPPAAAIDAPHTG